MRNKSVPYATPMATATAPDTRVIENKYSTEIGAWLTFSFHGECSYFRPEE